MKKQYLYFLLTFITGLAIGVSWTIISNHLVKASYIPEKYELKDLYLLANTKINTDNFSCEGFGSSVGSTLNAIFGANRNDYLNRISEDCYENKCTITHSNCKPWQSDSCGSTSLVFTIDDGGNIEKHSFKCLQMP